MRELHLGLTLLKQKDTVVVVLIVCRYCFVLVGKVIIAVIGWIFTVNLVSNEKIAKIVLRMMGRRIDNVLGLRFCSASNTYMHKQNYCSKTLSSMDLVILLLRQC